MKGLKQKAKELKILPWTRWGATRGFKQGSDSIRFRRIIWAVGRRLVWAKRDQRQGDLG